MIDDDLKIPLTKEDFQYNTYVIRFLLNENSIGFKMKVLSKEDFLECYSEREREIWFSCIEEKRSLL
jgi:hypothetical protein